MINVRLLFPTDLTQTEITNLKQLNLNMESNTITITAHNHIGHDPLIQRQLAKQASMPIGTNMNEIDMKLSLVSEHGVIMAEFENVYIQIIDYERSMIAFRYSGTSTK